MVGRQDLTHPFAAIVTDQVDLLDVEVVDAPQQQFSLTRHGAHARELRS
jgi:hypothetical protein